MTEQTFSGYIAFAQQNV